MMPTTNNATTAAEAIQQQNERNNNVLLNTVVPDTTYQAEYTKFKTFVRENTETLALDGTVTKSITRLTVDRYFAHVVVDRNGIRNTIRRIVSALQWFVTHREYVGVNDTFFDVESPTVNTCIEIQQERYLQYLDGVESIRDPHADLKDVVPISDRKKLMDYIYVQRSSDWAEACLSFTWGQNAAVRGASARKLTFCDLRCSRGFGPSQDGPGARALMLVLRKGRAHKDRFSTAKQVCCWIHKEFECCSVLATALAFIFKLRSHGSNLLFKKQRGGRRPLWWDYELLDWMVYDGK
jgi:hypothetical protein